MNKLEHYDIAVVGGGIAGLYCCLHAPQGMRIALFEATERIGGKVETVGMDGFQAEYGSMRFDPDRQHAMGTLIRELGVDTHGQSPWHSDGFELCSTPFGRIRIPPRA